MVKAAEVQVVYACANLADGTFKDRMLMYFHIEHTPAKIVDPFVKACPYFEESQLALWHTVVESATKKIITIIQPEANVTIVGDFCRKLLKELVGQLLVGVYEEHPRCRKPVVYENP